MLSYKQWAESTQRDQHYIVIENKPPHRIYYDRFIRVFILPDQEKVVAFEDFYAIACSR